MKQLDQIHRLMSVKSLTGLSRSTIYRLIAEGNFPKPIKLGARASGWRQSEIEAWIDSRSSTKPLSGEVRP